MDLMHEEPEPTPEERDPSYGGAWSLRFCPRGWW